MVGGGHGFVPARGRSTHGAHLGRAEDGRRSVAIARSWAATNAAQSRLPNLGRKVIAGGELAVPAWVM